MTLKVRKIPVEVFNLHDFIYAICDCGDEQIRRSMTGNMSTEEHYNFWRHIHTCPDLDHPVLANGTANYDILSRMCPCSIHIDGAELFTNSEFLWWSASFPFASGNIFDRKLPLISVRRSQVVSKDILDREAIHAATIVANIYIGSPWPSL